MKDITRREFFRMCSKDTLKDTVKAWQGFRKEVDDAKRLSCDDAAFRLFGKAQKKVSKIQS